MDADSDLDEFITDSEILRGFPDLAAGINSDNC
jgi:hypothetical protein